MKKKIEAIRQSLIHRRNIGDKMYEENVRRTLSFLQWVHAPGLDLT